MMWVETVAILVFFALRIGVPFLVVMGISYLVYRWLGDSESSYSPSGAQTSTGDRHCWDMFACPPEVRASCPAFRRHELPCWLAIMLAEGRLRQECLACPMYTGRQPTGDVGLDATATGSRAYEGT